MMKKITKVILMTILIILTFGLGWYCGLNFFTWTFNHTELTKAYVELMPLQTDIEALDRKDYAALRTSINLRLDAQIIKVYNLIDDNKNTSDNIKAKNMLARVAKHRKEFPGAYPTYPEKNEYTENVHKHVEAMLAEFIDSK
jgi:hypothetical protein